MRINTNLTAMNTYTQYTKNSKSIASSVAKLSSGYAINSAADNAAGLAISEKMRAQIRGLQKASTNSQDAISLVQTAEGSLSESTQILQRMRELAVQSSSDTNENKIDRAALQDEFSQLQSELNDISKNTSFNKKNLLDGSLAKNTASLNNVALAKSGLSIDLGKVSAGSYAFSVGVKQESAAVAGVKSEFTATSSNTGFTVGAVTNNLGASAMANGNYTITAKYDTDNKNMTFTAKGDNGQTFSATLSQSDLETGVKGTPAAMTLNFKNTDSTDPAFSFTLTTGSSYDTTSDATMTSLATQITSALSLSASKGVDAQDATYGLYAKMTGAEDVKLAAGMDSVTFSNGVKVSFDKLTTTDVSTQNTSAATADAAGTVTAAGAGATGTTIKYSNYKASDDASITAGDLSITAAADGTTGVKLTATNGTKTYSVVLSDDQLTALNTTAAEGLAETDKTLSGVKFTASDGTSFTMDITNDVTKATSGADTAVTFDHTAFTGLSANGTNGTVGTLTSSGHKSDAIFGADGAKSSFTIENKAGAGLTFQVGANEGDEMVINIDKMDANYLGVASASVATQSSASAAITSVDNAINQVSSQRAYLGAIQNRLDHKIANLNTSAENLTSAESVIRDVDMAKEMTKFTNANILSQASTAMLSQANNLPQSVLKLIG